jgi:hypothetical protein
MEPTENKVPMEYLYVAVGLSCNKDYPTMIHVTHTLKDMRQYLASHALVFTDLAVFDDDGDGVCCLVDEIELSADTFAILVKGSSFQPCRPHLAIYKTKGDLLSVISGCRELLV